MRWYRDFVESVVAGLRLDAVHVHVQPWDLGWFSLLVPTCGLAGLEEMVPVVVPLHCARRVLPGCRLDLPGESESCCGNSNGSSGVLWLSKLGEVG